MRREGEVQGDLVVNWAEMPRSPGHAFYDKLQKQRPALMALPRISANLSSAEDGGAVLPAGRLPRRYVTTSLEPDYGSKYGHTRCSTLARSRPKNRAAVGCLRSCILGGVPTC